MIRVHVVAGFLGAGKTSYIQHYLQERPAGGRLAIIENEFGQVGLDGKLLQQEDWPVREISAGCICCSLAGDFRRALRQLARDYALEEVIIEPTGVSRLSDVLQSLRSLKKEGLELETGDLLTVVDGQKVERYLDNFADFYEDQLRRATKILVNRLKEEKLPATIQILRSLNPRAEVFLEEWPLLSSAPPAPPERQEKLAVPSARAALRGGRSFRILPQAATPAAHQVFSSLAYHSGAWTKPQLDRLRQALDERRFGDILRMKGIFPMAGAAPSAPWFHVEYTGGDFHVEEDFSPREGEEALLLFIAQRPAPQEEEILAFFQEVGVEGVLIP